MVDCGRPESTALQKSTRERTNTETSVQATSRPSSRRIWRRRLRWKKHVCAVFAIWARMVISESKSTPRLRTLSTGVIVCWSTTTLVVEGDSRWSIVDEPNHMTFVLPGFSCSLRAPNIFQTTLYSYAYNSNLGLWDCATRHSMISSAQRLVLRLFSCWSDTHEKSHIKREWLKTDGECAAFNGTATTIEGHLLPLKIVINEWAWRKNRPIILKCVWNRGCR